MVAPTLFAIMGPTASGKSRVAEAIAEAHRALIVNADAFQIYQGMDVGTAKPREKSHYRLLDIRTPDQEFGVGEFVILAANLLSEQYASARSVVVCGGTGLYIRALVEQYKDLMPSPTPELRESLVPWSLTEAVQKLTAIAPLVAAQIDLQNEIRVKRSLEKELSNQSPIEFSIPPFAIKKIGIVPWPENSQSKIKQRTVEMFQNGWVAEVKDLLDNGYGPGNPGFRALGYEAIAEHIQGNGNEEVLIERIMSDTVKYAKRQRTWLRAEPNLVVFSDASDALDAIGHQQ